MGSRSSRSWQTPMCWRRPRAAPATGLGSRWLSYGSRFCTTTSVPTAMLSTRESVAMCSPQRAHEEHICPACVGSAQLHTHGALAHGRGILICPAASSPDIADVWCRAFLIACLLSHMPFSFLRGARLPAGTKSITLRARGWATHPERPRPSIALASICSFSRTPRTTRSGGSTCVVRACARACVCVRVRVDVGGWVDAFARVCVCSSVVSRCCCRWLGTHKKCGSGTHDCVRGCELRQMPTTRG
jgi:hypothetical protein